MCGDVMAASQNQNHTAKAGRKDREPSVQTKIGQWYLLPNRLWIGAIF